jgi:hypothetical protein
MVDDPAQTHPVHAALQQLEALRESSQLTDLNEEIDDLRRYSLDRIFYVASEARKRVSKLKGNRVPVRDCCGRCFAGIVHGARVSSSSHQCR